MGAWGFGSFENDEALDWVAELEESPSLEPVRLALKAASQDSTGFGISGTAECAIAAAEVVAAMRGRPAADLPDEVRACLPRWSAGAEALDQLASIARHVCETVIQDEEMRSRFADEQDAAEWETVVRDLIRRLEG